MRSLMRLITSDGAVPEVAAPESYLTEDARTRVHQLSERLGLLPTERDVLAAALAAAIDPAAGTVLQMLQNDAAGVGVRSHAFARWLGGDGALTAELVDALAPDGPLLRWSLIERLEGGATPLAFERWMAPRGVVAYVLGAGSRELPAGEETPALAREELAQVSGAILRGGSLRLIARDVRELGRAVEQSLRALGARPLRTTAPLGAGVLRDALLANAVLVVDVPHGAEDNTARDQTLRTALEQAATAQVPVLLLASTPANATGVADAELPIAPPPPLERRALWSDALARRGIGAAPAAVVAAADSFAVGRGPIERAAARLAAKQITAASPLALGAALADESPDAAGALGDFEPLPRDEQLDWSTLHAPDETLEELQLLTARCRHRRLVFDDLRMADLAGTRGVVALFYGPPGTGKTLATRMISAALGWRLLRIDASRLVSKWIGETEKNLARILDAAEDGRFALLFDEADALFGKRSTENKGGTDRYANMEINYLLQRLDRFDGVAFLTSNHEQAIDEAFRRRLSARIEFPMPEEPIRARLWRTMVPAEVLLDRATLATLAKPELSGGHIKNAVLRAAFVAAEHGRMLASEDLVRGLELELRSCGVLAGRPAIAARHTTR